MADHPASYAALTATRKTNPLLLHALRRTGIRGGRALDIGAGAFGETRHLLGMGFTVDAVDRDPVSRDLASSVAAEPGRFTPVQVDIQDFTIPAGGYDIILALHVLPFLPPDDVVAVAESVVRGLRPGGVLCCSVLGERDSWAGVSATAMREHRAVELFAALSPLYFAEREHDGTDAEAKPKHWHVYRQILVKPHHPTPRTEPTRTETSGRIGTDYHHQRFW